MTGNAVTMGTILIETLFSTKDQRPFITPEIEPLLYDKISKILYDECFSPALKIGGDVEHVHVLYVNARDRSPDFIISRVKHRSAEFIRKWSPEFDWQETYVAVTVSRSEDEFVKDYSGVRRRSIRCFRTRTNSENFLRITELSMMKMIFGIDRICPDFTK